MIHTEGKRFENKVEQLNTNWVHTGRINVSDRTQTDFYDFRGLSLSAMSLMKPKKFVKT
jgi:hypothetical protein